MPKRDESWYQAEARECALRFRAYELSAARAEGFAEGLEEGRKEGRKEAVIIGQIRLLQELQGIPITPREELIQLDARALQDVLQELKATMKP